MYKKEIFSRINNPQKSEKFLSSISMIFVSIVGMTTVVIKSVRTLPLKKRAQMFSSIFLHPILKLSITIGVSKNHINF
jgi:hypothetical protein